MKVIGICGSLRKNGNTEYYLRYTLDRLSAEGIETEYISLINKNIKPCMGCYRCKDIQKCIQEDDCAPIFEKMYEADGIIVGSPVYYSSVVPQLMALLDRAAFCLRQSGKYFTGKVGAPITVARRAGHNLAFAQLLMWYYINEMIIPGNIYWNVATAGAAGARDPENDKEAHDIMDHFAKNMAWVMKKIKS
ncbi:MAG: flavodoxin family protein [Bacillota bacterium]